LIFNEDIALLYLSLLEDIAVSYPSIIRPILYMLCAFYLE